MRVSIVVVGVMLLGAVIAAWFAPYVDSELAVGLEPHTIVDSEMAKLAKGRMVDEDFAVEDLGKASFRVSEWLAPGEVIDLGGRALRAVSTPGYTPSSVALFDSASRRLFIGDFIYPTTLYVFLPGASLSAYQATSCQPVYRSFTGSSCLLSAI